MDPASTYLDASLERSRATGVQRAIRWIGAIASAGLGDGVDAPDVDLVVRRRDTGAEVIRTHADTGSPADLLASVREELETQTVTEFLESWR
ncbi:MAG TPA: hypothetical protein VN200_10200 [Rhodoglobus sp.]|nr:hypothetical protein [Rhodoglobus sp.]